MRAKIGVFAAAAVVVTLSSGCGKALEDFVRVNRPAPLQQLPNVGLSTESAIKISPGRTSSVGGDVAMTANVTITERRLDGGDVTAKVSVSRQRQE